MRKFRLPYVMYIGDFRTEIPISVRNMHRAILYLCILHRCGMPQYHFSIIKEDML